MNEEEKKAKADLINHLVGRGFKGDSTWHRYCLAPECENPSTGQFCFLHWRQLSKGDQKRLRVHPSERLGHIHIIGIQTILKYTKFAPVFQLEIIENYSEE